MVASRNLAISQYVHVFPSGTLSFSLSLSFSCVEETGILISPALMSPRVTLKMIVEKTVHFCNANGILRVAIMEPPLRFGESSVRESVRACEAFHGHILDEPTPEDCYLSSRSGSSVLAVGYRGADCMYVRALREYGYMVVMPLAIISEQGLDDNASTHMTNYLICTMNARDQMTNWLPSDLEARFQIEEAARMEQRATGIAAGVVPDVVHVGEEFFTVDAQEEMDRILWDLNRMGSSAMIVVYAGQVLRMDIEDGDVPDLVDANDNAVSVERMTD